MTKDLTERLTEACAKATQPATNTQLKEIFARNLHFQRTDGRRKKTVGLAQVYLDELDSLFDRIRVTESELTTLRADIAKKDAALRLAAGALQAGQSSMSPRVAFTGEWRHLGTLSVSEILDAADAALSQGSGSADGWKPMPAPDLERVIVAGWQKRSGSTAGYWWYHEDATDDKGIPIDHPEASLWLPLSDLLPPFPAAPLPSPKQEGGL